MSDVLERFAPYSEQVFTRKVLITIQAEVVLVYGENEKIDETKIQIDGEDCIRKQLVELNLPDNFGPIGIEIMKK